MNLIYIYIYSYLKNVFRIKKLILILTDLRIKLVIYQYAKR